jgi:hypothetical protein
MANTELYYYDDAILTALVEAPGIGRETVDFH